ncbi:hypothetical protein [Peribacillus acanthi]|uniref:hypothetical protein n=1 Tax=Peribacillus acanthi TaxID=2171554 RepID=UPI0013004C29|nr:hypothetical protein [Peribacillus acanthi]
MMTRNQLNEREQLEVWAIDQLVPDDHLVLKIEAAIVPTGTGLIIHDDNEGRVSAIKI